MARRVLRPLRFCSPCPGGDPEEQGLAPQRLSFSVPRHLACLGPRVLHLSLVPARTKCSEWLQTGSHSPQVAGGKCTLFEMRGLKIKTVSAPAEFKCQENTSLLEA